MAAKKRGAEAHALFVGKSDYLDREGQALAGFVHAPNAFDRAEDAEEAIVPAGIAHAVHVGAGQQRRRARCRAFVAADDIAERVECGVHARFLHPAEDLLAGGAMLRRKERACNTRRVFGELCQLVGTRKNSRARVSVHHDRRSSHWDGVTGEGQSLPPAYFIAVRTTPSLLLRAGWRSRGGATRSRTKLGSANTASCVSPL